MSKYKRPTAVTIISLLLFIGVITMFGAALFGIVSGISTLYPVQLLFSAFVAGFICFGFWTMQKWAAISYVVLTFFAQIFLIFAGTWNVFSLLLPAIVAIIGIYYYPQMRSGWSRPTAADLPGWSTVKIGLASIAGFFVITALAIGGFRMYLKIATTDSDQTARSEATTTTVSLDEIEDKALAKKLKKIMPQPSDFSGDFTIDNPHFTIDSKGKITYTAQWINSAAKKIESYREESGSQLQRPVPLHIQSATKNMQMFTLSISHIGTTTNQFANLKNNFSELPALLKAYTEENIVTKRNVSGVGEKYYSYQASPPKNPSKFSYYSFQRNGYRVDFQIFITMNNNQVFKDEILPKARVVDQQIQNME